jgi:hypothetical protein
LRIVSLRVRHYRGEPPVYHGDLGETSFATSFDDDLRVSARFSTRAYCYLIAFNADGKEQLCYPANRDVSPTPVEELTYPEKANNYFSLNDGVGFQVFVLAASRQPLPPYSRWRAEVPWQSVRGDGVWRSTGKELEFLAPLERGPERPRGVAPQPLRDLGTFFQGRPGITAHEIVAFPVKAKPSEKGP